MKKLLAFFTLAVTATNLSQGAPTLHLVQKIDLSQFVVPKLKAYHSRYKDSEFFSGLGVAVGMPGAPIQDFYVGNVSREANSMAVTRRSLFQIGSITKSFTAVLILQLVKAGKLRLTDTVGDFLPTYKKWADITLAQLLNMSSGLPNYSETPSWNYKEAINPKRKWTLESLIDFAYPRFDYRPPLHRGYYYTNTGYLLAELVIEKAAQQQFSALLQEKILKPQQLAQTFYPVPTLPLKQKRQLMHGYGYNQYDNPELLGQDMQHNDLSWAASAGAMLATAPQIVQWVRALFIEKTLLTEAQKKTLTQMISLSSGKPLQQLDVINPKGFGLGVIQAYSSKLGRYWYYEGETLGFRAMYLYMPCNKIIVSATVNSATNTDNDHLHELLQEIYSSLLTHYPRYKCTPASL